LQFDYVAQIEQLDEAILIEQNEIFVENRLKFGFFDVFYLLVYGQTVLFQSSARQQ